MNNIKKEHYGNVVLNSHYNEPEMLEICKKYGIDTVEKEGTPLLCGKEMDENFSFQDLMLKESDLNGE